MQTIRLPADGTSRWAGMADYLLLSPDGGHRVLLKYAGEPPHGDSFHVVEIDGTRLPGFAWGCNFAFTRDSRFFAASWMAEPYERKTVVVDLKRRGYFVLSDYVADFTFHWPTLSGVGQSEGVSFAFDGSEVWSTF